MAALKLKVWRLFLRVARDLVWRADEWIQRQEVALREAPARAATLAEVDPAASREREKFIQRNSQGASTNPQSTEWNGSGAFSHARALHSCPLATGKESAVGRTRRRRPVKQPRLRYTAGQFVREARP